MNILLFTSNRPRHLYFIDQLYKSIPHANITAVVESGTLFYGSSPGFYRTSSISQKYFSHVRSAEHKWFGYPHLLPPIQTFIAQWGDISNLDPSVFLPMIDQADVILVYASSWIRGGLFSLLHQKNAINIHLGVSPYYRGAACNFWALYDLNPHLVGATIHYLNSSLDSGPILKIIHSDTLDCDNCFEFTMKPVKLAIDFIAKNLSTYRPSDSVSFLDNNAIPQNKNLEIRYTKNSDFTDEIASNFLENIPSILDIASSLSAKSN